MLAVKWAGCSGRRIIGQVTESWPACRRNPNAPPFLLGALILAWVQPLTLRSWPNLLHFLGLHFLPFKIKAWDLPGSPMAETLCSQCRGLALIPGQGTGSHVESHVLQLRVHMLLLKIPQAATKIEDLVCCN